MNIKKFTNNMISEYSLRKQIKTCTYRHLNLRLLETVQAKSSPRGQEELVQIPLRSIFFTSSKLVFSFPKCQDLKYFYYLIYH